MVVYAKSYPRDNPESLKVHVETLLEELNRIKFIYGEYIINRIPESLREYFWVALEIVCKVHDLGKIHTPFQNVIRKTLGLELLPYSYNNNIPHNLLSAAFLKDLVQRFPEEIQNAIFQTVAFHHSRGVDDITVNGWRKVVDAIENDLKLNLERLDEMKCFFDEKIPQPKINFRYKLKSSLKDDYQKFFIFLKGLFHRIDHSASAGLEIEIKPSSNTSQLISTYLNKKGIQNYEIWQKRIAEECNNDCVVFQASTGSGKTEFSLYWLGNEKGFYTLPVRTSVNAMYERLKDTYQTENVGLLHSDSYFYVIEEFNKLSKINNQNTEGLEQSIIRMDLSKQMSMPLTVSTADQLFTAVFKYRGYEKIYASLAYSRIIIDEVQSYDPDMVAIILKGLEDTFKLGGKFCVVTATLPEIYLNYIKENIPSIKILPQRVGNHKKHKIKLLPNSILDNEVIEIIKRSYQKYGKILIIVNTIKRSQELFEILREKVRGSVSLLHAGFIYKDRRKRESKYEPGSILNSQEGIWITTQLAEVSLDIDFPVMVTEVSTIDSQIQRWGRVWRHKTCDYDDNEPNIYICQDASGLIDSKGRALIYDKDLMKLSTEVLKCYDNILISQENECEVIQKVFGNADFIKTNYYKRFKNSLTLIKDLNFTIENKSEAQRLFRKLTSVKVIPLPVYLENKSRINESIALLSSKISREEKLNALYIINQFTLSLPEWKIKSSKLFPGVLDIFIAEFNYSTEKGIIIR